MTGLMWLGLFLCLGCFCSLYEKPIRFWFVILASTYMGIHRWWFEDNGTFFGVPNPVADQILYGGLDVFIIWAMALTILVSPLIWLRIFVGFEIGKYLGGNHGKG